jgi:LPPG:FO 2-phospho-L-lactate transferase
VSSLTQSKVLAICGGVGGAKLALGLSKILSPEQLTIVVNTGDDFEHLGLTICPDLDTVTYTLAELSNQELGWGRRNESWRCLEALGELGGPTWFRLGDTDIATHMARRALLDEGKSLAEATARITQRLGIDHAVVPMCNEAVRTMIDTEDGEISFQHYFVREQCRPVIRGIRFDGADRAKLAPAFEEALDDPDLGAILICPSNPFVSVAPIQAIPDVENRLRQHKAPVVAVSPIVASKAIKGPSAKMMQELGLELSALGVYQYYGDLLDGFILDEVDRGLIDNCPESKRFHCCNTVMQNLDDRIALARECLQFASSLSG